MASSDITKATVWEDGGATCLARVLGNAGTAITQASLTSIGCKVFDLNSTTPETAVSTPTVTIASAVFDTLQTDARWTVDSTGYNFLFVIAASVLTTGDHRYRVEFKFTPASGEVFWLVYELHAQAVSTS